MKRFLLKKLGRTIAVRIFRNETLAAHNLRIGGSVAGVVDECKGRRVRGWIYDAKRPDASLDLEILLDGKVVERTKADLYRDDIAALLGDNGFHGFSCDVTAFEKPCAEMRFVSVRLADRPNYRLGPFALPPNRSPLEAPSPGVPQALHDRLAHIFNHITAVHEESQRRFDVMQAALDRTQSREGVRLGSGVSGGGQFASILYEYPRSGISGVGQFGPLLEDEMEAAIFQAQLEMDLLKERHFS